MMRARIGLVCVACVVLSVGALTADAADIAGRVVDQDGKPVAEGEVFLILGSKGAVFRNGRLDRGIDTPRTKTERDGRFSLPRPTESFTLVVYSERGFAERKPEQLTTAKNVTVTPWGRVEGTVRIGAKPGSAVRVQLVDNHPKYLEARLMFVDEITADDQGHFQVDRVVPGEVVASRLLSQGGTKIPTNIVWFTVAPGQTARVTIGGSGRPVIGRIAQPEETVLAVDWAKATGSLVSHHPPPPFPPDYRSWSEERQKEWYSSFLKSETHKTFLHRIHSYAMTFAADGTFRADDVVPDTYTLTLRFEDQRPGFKVSGKGGRDPVVVPEILGGRSDEPLDIGPVELPIIGFSERKVGDLAPGFSIKTIDGKPFALADTRGKYVLLDFWAAWCVPCRKELPLLKELHDAFGTDKRFVMIGLSLDKEPEAPRKYADENGLPWLQGFLGALSQSTVAGDYGVLGIPSIWLVGPDGKILAKGLRGERIKEAVSQALSHE